MLERAQSWLRVAALALVLCVERGAGPVLADDGEKEIERYRAMINDPMANPAFLNVDRGEALWKEARGANKISLETCDLGEGPGKLEGAYAKLPRYLPMPITCWISSKGCCGAWRKSRPSIRRTSFRASSAWTRQDLGYGGSRRLHCQ